MKIIKDVFRKYLKKSIEKWVFFFLFLVLCLFLAYLIFNLPYFKVSLYEQKIVRNTTASAINKVDVKPYEDLRKVLVKPEDYFKLYSRDIFSPLIEQIQCPSCGKDVAKNLDVCPYCSFNFDTDGDGMPNEWERKYKLNITDPQDSYLDKDGDSYTNLDEFNASTDPTNPNSKPMEYNPLGKYRLIKIYKKPVELLFDGYMLLPDGTYSFAINFQNSTQFRKIGETIKDYKILEFKKNIVQENRMGVEVTDDKSYLTMLTKEGDKIILKYHEVATKKELWVQLENVEEQKVKELRKGDAFGQFKITEITDDEINVIDDKDNKFNLKYKRSKQ